MVKRLFGLWLNSHCVGTIPNGSDHRDKRTTTSPGKKEWGRGRARQESTQRLLLFILFPSLDNDFNWQRVENSAAFIFAAPYRAGMLKQSSVGEIRLLPLLMQASY